MNYSDGKKTVSFAVTAPALLSVFFLLCSSAWAIQGGKTLERSDPDFGRVAPLLTSFQKKSGECSATYLGDGFFLTAAHCDPDATAKIPLKEGDVFLAWPEKKGIHLIELRVLILPFDEYLNVEPSNQRIAEVMKKHGIPYGDIALLRAFDTEKAEKFFKATPILEDDLLLEVTADPKPSVSDARILGSGQVAPAPKHLELEEKMDILGQLHLAVRRLTLRALRAPIPENFNIPLYLDQFAVATGADRGPCVGDSGAPLLVTHKGKTKIAGVVQHTRADCSTYSMLGSPHYYREWIEEARLQLNGQREAELKKLMTQSPEFFDGKNLKGDHPYFHEKYIE